MYLGDVPVGDSFTVRVTWTVAVDSPAVSGSSLTLTHEDGGTVIGPLAGSLEATDIFKVSTSVPRGGRWRVRWETTPPGGSTSHVLYAG